jgi:hypothetical protein
LDARDRKLQARLAKAKKAHDDLIAAAYRAQADALDMRRRQSGGWPTNMMQRRRVERWRHGKTRQGHLTICLAEKWSRP